MGLLLLTLTTCGLVLHSWFFIEVQFNGIALNGITLVKFYRIVNPMKNTLLTNPHIFIYTMSFIFIKHL